MLTLLKTAQGEFTLKRYPIQHNQQLRAWDAADEYSLNYLAETSMTDNNTRILLLNDSFGALTVALHAFKPVSISDSYLAQQATLANLIANNLDPHQVQLINSLETPKALFNLVIIKIPKTLALLEDQLIRLQPHISTSTKIIAAGMGKYIPSSVWSLLERLIGPTTTPPAKKKAKLIITTVISQLSIPDNPYPVYYQLEHSDYQICNYANVFSRASLDIGTRFLLEHLPQHKNAQDIIDLGCGNGVVGLILAKKHPRAKLHFIDESYMAIASARQTFKLAFKDRSNATFKVNDALSGFNPATADLIVCNPPFHQQNNINDQTAKRMFKQSRVVLRKGGELWVIGNRHLGYHQILKRLFGNAEVCAANAKFVIIKAIVMV
jgi:16S rRNA (guanine1207-N2)-methyltransferase